MPQAGTEGGSTVIPGELASVAKLVSGGGGILGEWILGGGMLGGETLGEWCYLVILHLS